MKFEPNVRNGKFTFVKLTKIRHITFINMPLYMKY